MAVVKLSKNSFEAEVLQSDKPVLVDFWASWCGPCMMVSPIVDKLADELTDIKVGKVNVDDEQELAREYGVMSIPTLMLFKDGKPAQRMVGANSQEQIVKMIRQ